MKEMCKTFIGKDDITQVAKEIRLDMKDMCKTFIGKDDITEVAKEIRLMKVIKIRKEINILKTDKKEHFPEPDPKEYIHKIVKEIRLDMKDMFNTYIPGYT